MRGQDAGRTLMVGLPGPALDPQTATHLAELQPGGVILFSRNLISVEQTVDLLDAVRRTLPYPLLLAIDQEGGRVSRLEPWIGATPAAERWPRAGSNAIRGFACSTARVLRSLGLNLDFAPVVDLSPPDAPNGIGNRSFGLDAERVTQAARAFLDGLQSEGVAGCLKHFPGLGDTVVDSHQVLPTVHRSRADLERDLLPYRRLGPSAACVMVGHGSYPALDPLEERPACLSPLVVERLLRNELGYRGLVVTDDFEMGALRPWDTDGSAGVQALEAGCDMLLYCADLDRADRALDAIVHRGERDTGFRARVDLARAAVERTAVRWKIEPGDASAWDRARLDLRQSVRCV